MSGDGKKPSSKAKKSRANPSGSKRPPLVTKPAPGRPPLNPADFIDTLVELVEKGNFVEVAAATIGLDRDTLYDWMKRGARAEQGRGKPGDEAYIDFSGTLRKAIARSETDAISTIESVGRFGDWRATAWRLERRFPQRWAKIDKVEHSGPGGTPIQHSHEVDLSRLSTEELEQLDAILEKARPVEPTEPEEGEGIE